MERPVRRSPRMARRPITTVVAIIVTVGEIVPKVRSPKAAIRKQNNKLISIYDSI
jgi:hypothetical protein